MCHEDWQPKGDLSDGQACTYLASDGVEIPGWRYEPSTTKSKGSCLVLPDIFGPSPFYHKVASLLAEAGYDTVMIEYFFREGAIAEITREAAFARRAKMDENLCLRDISHVLDQLSVAGPSPKLGLIGFCLSGTYAYDLTTMRTDLAAVSFYGFPEGPGGPVVDRAPRPVDVVDKLRGPILSFWGDADHIPVDLVTKFGKDATAHVDEYEQYIYPGVGHGFLQGLVENRPDSEAARSAWSRTIGFLDNKLAALEI